MQAQLENLARSAVRHGQIKMLNDLTHYLGRNMSTVTIRDVVLWIQSEMDQLQAGHDASKEELERWDSCQ